MRHVLTNVLGAREQTDVHIYDLPLIAGERVLLCSDGLYGSVDDDALGQDARQRGSVEERRRASSTSRSSRARATTSRRS